MANEPPSETLYSPMFVPDMQFWVKTARERTKSTWRSQHPNTLILTAFVKNHEGGKYAESRVPVWVKVVPGPSVSLNEAQSDEIFELLRIWLHPPGDIHLDSETRRDMQRACMMRALGQNRPYKVTCLNVVKEGYVIELQLLNSHRERYQLSFTLKSHDPGNYDDPIDSIVGETSGDGNEDQDQDDETKTKMP
ncbi:hypothetical protein SCHPADRAFT_923866 [Schizopora paradoxa]|uniref:Uncharacterized protein n=1 Tax=Schizopora paradoxa TaxID=27342 RepID=A0A0H2SE60_9AGAM|nr:hypothetical protein SCHPADRAFT_923866 [Schizopora paradoxa]